MGESVENPAVGSRSGRGARKVVRLVFLVPAILLIGLVATFLYHPDDQPASVNVNSSQLTGLWKAAGGGKIVLHSDGTFSAQHSCPFGQEEDPGSANGTWTMASSGDWGHGMGVQFVFDKVYIGMGVSKEGGTLVLWRHVGDPDEGNYCKVRK
ncbi:hypothetical protein A6P39_009795 [Streptomyces sp. FXJ1.172]|uniref:hypothetical protein n=1 Tax=Streptomyces sp. FXJ1.172 TaxID=710705 RepID=UPI00133148E6|nr:hypothetical protein [Streptomyces sp. FXJ1.172]WEO94283.1 hypothetical protein A6P39_009795 [Streptomyces sp. FXJ1.172]